jgi:hypothetical protein
MPLHAEYESPRANVLDALDHTVVCPRHSLEIIARLAHGLMMMRIYSQLIVFAFLRKFK